MKAEIIAVGTELLLGQIVNTNAQYLSQQLAGLGVHVYFQTVVGDNALRLEEALRIAKQRADLVLLTGGLGPTQDDLTKDAVAGFTGRKLVIHEESMRRISSFFEERGIPMVESNARQALLPEGADALMNDTGMAVGAAYEHDGTLYMMLPGPPRELKPMFEQYSIPWIRKMMGDEQPLFSKMLKFAGIGESSLEHALIDLIDSQQDPSIAPYAKEGEVTIRLTTKASSVEEGAAKIATTEAEIRARVGDYLYATEDISIEQAVMALLTKRGETLALAESCTGGLLSDMITTIPGSSDIFAGGIVCYTNQVKRELLGLPSELLEGEGAPGAVSEETALALATAVRQRFGTTYGVSVTGVAGPAESEGKPVGLVFVGVAGPGGEPQVFKLSLRGNRSLIKLRAAKSAFYRLWTLLK
ncbi:competence/damage-inducible protein A [Paenibacillus turpanensis]|uniref:competence/damage-inducible protein A n=1 Tax=Paenibacillus turpanensis TaxID=2689078 RepID=UPI00140B8827|nr:competence/damage-inducible protein A [Paenibacillus turpanensis]